MIISIQWVLMKQAHENTILLIFIIITIIIIIIVFCRLFFGTPCIMDKKDNHAILSLYMVKSNILSCSLKYSLIKFGWNREIAEELQNMEWPCMRNNIYAICTRQYPISAIYWSRVREWCNEE